MITRKYKVHEAAKDFAIGGKELSSKDILSIIDPDGSDGKKYSTVLTEEELSQIFDRLTLDNSVQNFMEFFAEAMAAAAVKQEEQAKKQAAQAAQDALKASEAASAKQAQASSQHAPAQQDAAQSVKKAESTQAVPAKQAQPKPAEPKKNAAESRRLPAACRHAARYDAHRTQTTKGARDPAASGARAAYG